MRLYYKNLFRPRMKIGHRRKGLSLKWFVFAFILFTVLLLSEIGISSISQELTQEAAVKHIISSVNSAVEKKLKKSEQGYFVHITRDSSGNVTSVEADAKKLNEFKTEITDAAIKKLNGRHRVGIPAGSLTNIRILNGRGFSVPVKHNFEGTADITFESAFYSAGINQSCHRITMKVTSSVFSQSRKFKESAEHTTEFIISETIIVGSVPELMALPDYIGD